MKQNEPDKKGLGSEIKSPFVGPGMLAGIAVILVIAVISGIFFWGSPGSVSPVPSQSCGRQVVSYVNANLVQQGTSAELVGVKEANGVYEITTRYQGNEVPLYATRDCALLFTGSFRITDSAACDPQAGACSPSQAQAGRTPVPPVKSARPTVELYVMSFCPYGVQAEKVFQPVVALLGKKADFRIRYITTVQGDTIGSVQSLHGSAEAVEDARQLCILNYAPDKYWQYLSAFDELCYPVWNTPSQLAACQKNVTATLGISADKIDRCVSGSEAIGLLRTDQKMAEENKATASPTLLINGQPYQGSRTPEAFKEAICSHFESKPAECDSVLSSQSATAAGNCG